MNEKITSFLNSGLLENYMLGLTSNSDTAKVEQYINNYPEVKIAYNTLQDNLEIVAKANAIEAPNSILDNVLNTIDDAPVIALQKPEAKKPSLWSNKFAVAASVAAIIFATTSFMFYQQNQRLSQENQVVVDEIFDLRDDIEANKQKLNVVMGQFQELNNPETQKYVMRGNARALDLQTVAYINPKQRLAMIDVVSLPDLPEEQQYELWAELQDKMVSLGYLSKEDANLRRISYSEDALGLAITVESKENPNNNVFENPVAEIAFKKED